MLDMPALDACPPVAPRCGVRCTGGAPVLPLAPPAPATELARVRPGLGHEDILPDSRLKSGRDKGSFLLHGRNWIPVYCANCGRSQGAVPEEHMTFAFVLCTPCAETHGESAHFYCEPDVVFWQRVVDGEFDKLTPLEVHTELQDERSPLTKLVRDQLKGRL